MTVSENTVLLCFKTVGCIHCQLYHCYCCCFSFFLVLFPSSWVFLPYVFLGRCIAQAHTLTHKQGGKKAIGLCSRTFACLSCLTSNWGWCQNLTVMALFTSLFRNRCRTYKGKVCAPLCVLYVCTLPFQPGSVLDCRPQTSLRSEYCYLIGAIMPTPVRRHAQTHNFHPIASNHTRSPNEFKYGGGCTRGGWVSGFWRLRGWMGSRFIDGWVTLRQVS